jgi:hypothetical protein
MKIFAIISAARQVDGEYVIIKAEKAFLKASKAEEFFKNLAKNYAETIQTPTANIQCICERGIFEIDVED